MLTPALAVDAREPVSKLVSAFLKRRVSEAVVFSGKKYLGVVYSRDIAHRQDAEGMQVRHFVTAVKPAARLDRNALSNVMVINDYKAIPVLHEGRYFFLTNLGMLAAVQDAPAFEGKTAADIMRYPLCVSADETVAEAFHLARERKIERIPVVDEQHVVGVVTTASLLRMHSEKRRPTRGEARGEIIRALQISVRSLADQSYSTASPDSTVSQLVGVMLKDGTDTVLVQSGRRVVGIVTPKAILSLIGEDVKGVTVNISGLRVIESFEKAELEKQVDTFLKKVAPQVPVDYLAMHVERHYKGGVKTKYSIHARLITGKGFFFAQEFGWHLPQVMGAVLGDLRREVEKSRSRRR